MIDTDRTEKIAREHKVSLLRQVILDHTNSGDMFWLGEALLVAMTEAETQAVSSRAKKLDRTVMDELTRQVQAGCTHIASLNVNDLVSAILATEAAPSEPLDDKLVYIKPLRTLVRVQTMYADQVRDLCNAPAAPSEPDTLASAIEETETENYADLVDMANVGKAFMRELANNMPGYSYLQCPSEVICDLINQNFDANAHPPAQPDTRPDWKQDKDETTRIKPKPDTTKSGGEG